jgi:hypothetical protein
MLCVALGLKKRSSKMVTESIMSNHRDGNCCDEHITFNAATPLCEVLQYLHTNPNTTFIDLTNNQNVTDNLIFELMTRPVNQKLTGLILTNCYRLTHAGLAHLCSNHPLSSSFSSSFSLASSSSEQGEIFSCESSLPLRILDISGCSAIVTDDILQHIGNNSSFRLETFAARNCFRLTDFGLQFLTGDSCPHLTALDLGGCGQITDKGVMSLAFQLPNLSQLNLQGCLKVTSESIEVLARNCRDLKSLNLRGCARIDDDALDHLSTHCVCLENLNLQGCSRVTDASLLSLVHSCPNLSCLDLRRCSGISRLAIATVLALPHRFHSLYDDGNSHQDSP